MVPGFAEAKVQREPSVMKRRIAVLAPHRCARLFALTGVTERHPVNERFVYLSAFRLTNVTFPSTEISPRAKESNALDESRPPGGKNY